MSTHPFHNEILSFFSNKENDSSNFNMKGTQENLNI